MAEQAGGGRGDARPTPAAGKRSNPQTCWRGARAAGSQPASRAASEPALGALRPLREELADGPDSSRGYASAARSWANAERHSPEPQQGAARRAGPRHGPVIFGDPKIGPLARRTTGCGASAPAPVGALLPRLRASRYGGRASPLEGEGVRHSPKGDGGSGSRRQTRAPAPSSTGGGALAFSPSSCFIDHETGDS